MCFLSQSDRCAKIIGSKPPAYEIVEIHDNFFDCLATILLINGFTLKAQKPVGVCRSTACKPRARAAELRLLLLPTRPPKLPSINGYIWPILLKKSASVFQGGKVRTRD